MKSKIFKVIAILISLCLLFEQSGFAQIAGQLDISSHVLSLQHSFIQENFRPVHLRSIDITQNNLRVLLDKGTAKEKADNLQELTKKLLEYFFVGLTLPNDTFWVNLRPDGEDKIIDSWLERTDVGKIFLEADLQLKKDTASFTSPQCPEGRAYWDRLYKKAGELFGNENVTIPTLTRPWIVPGEVIVREAPTSAYIYKASLKVMLEQDYLRGSAVYNFKDPRLKALNEYASELVREIIIPKLTKEINTSKRYAPLRQVYYSLILAQWFKARFAGKQNIYSELINARDLTNLLSKEPWSKTTYFKAYQKSFKEGEYNLREPVQTPFGQVIRSYFSGGIKLMNVPMPIAAPTPNLGQPGKLSSPVKFTKPLKLVNPDTQAPTIAISTERGLEGLANANTISVKSDALGQDITIQEIGEEQQPISPSVIRQPAAPRPKTVDDLAFNMLFRMRFGRAPAAYREDIRQAIVEGRITFGPRGMDTFSVYNNGIDTANGTNARQLEELHKRAYSALLKSLPKGSKVEVLELGPGAGGTIKDLWDLAKDAQIKAYIDANSLTPIATRIILKASIKELKTFISDYTTKHPGEKLTDIGQYLRDGHISLDLLFQLQQAGYPVFEEALEPFIRKEYIVDFNKFQPERKYHVVVDNMGPVFYLAEGKNFQLVFNKIFDLLLERGFFCSPNRTFDMKQMEELIVPDGFIVLHDELSNAAFMVIRTGIDTPYAQQVATYIQNNNIKRITKGVYSVPDLRAIPGRLLPAAASSPLNKKTLAVSAIALATGFLSQLLGQNQAAIDNTLGVDSAKTSKEKVEYYVDTEKSMAGREIAKAKIIQGNFDDAVKTVAEDLVRDKNITVGDQELGRLIKRIKLESLNLGDTLITPSPKTLNIQTFIEGLHVAYILSGYQAIDTLLLPESGRIYFIGPKDFSAEEHESDIIAMEIGGDVIFYLEGLKTVIKDTRDEIRAPDKDLPGRDMFLNGLFGGKDDLYLYDFLAKEMTYHEIVHKETTAMIDSGKTDDKFARMLENISPRYNDNSYNDYRVKYEVSAYLAQISYSAEPKFIFSSLISWSDPRNESGFYGHAGQTITRVLFEKLGYMDYIKRRLENAASQDTAQREALSSILKEFGEGNMQGKREHYQYYVDFLNSLPNAAIRSAAGEIYEGIYGALPDQGAIKISDTVKKYLTGESAPEHKNKALELNYGSFETVKSYFLSADYERTLKQSYNLLSQIYRKPGAYEEFNKYIGDLEAVIMAAEIISGVSVINQGNVGWYRKAYKDHPILGPIISGEKKWDEKYDYLIKALKKWSGFEQMVDLIEREQAASSPVKSDYVFLKTSGGLIISLASGYQNLIGEELQRVARLITTEFNSDDFMESYGLVVGRKTGEVYTITNLIPLTQFKERDAVFVNPDPAAIIEVIQALRPGEIILGDYHNHSFERLVSNQKPGPSYADGARGHLDIPGYEDKIADDRLNLVLEPEMDLDKITMDELDDFHPRGAKVLVHAYMTPKERLGNEIINLGNFYLDSLVGRGGTIESAGSPVQKKEEWARRIEAMNGDPVRTAQFIDELAGIVGQMDEESIKDLRLKAIESAIIAANKIKTATRATNLIKDTKEARDRSSLVAEATKEEGFRGNYIRVGRVTVINAGLIIPRQIRQRIKDEIIIELAGPIDYLPSLVPMLQAMQQTDFQGKTVIDYGAGNGILGLVALALGAKRIIAIERDMETQNAQYNFNQAGYKTLFLDQLPSEELAQTEAQCILVHADLRDWFKNENEYWQEISAGNQVIRLAHLGYEYSVHGSLMAHLLSVVVKTPLIIGGYIKNGEEFEKAMGLDTDNPLQYILTQTKLFNKEEAEAIIKEAGVNKAWLGYESDRMLFTLYNALLGRKENMRWALDIGLFSDTNAKLFSALRAIPQPIVGPSTVPQVSSPVNFEDASTKAADKGGVDFRNLPITTQPMLPMAKSALLPFNPNLANLDLDKEWQDIQNMLRAGIIPSCERIKEYAQASCQSQDADSALVKVVSCIADILRMEEEQCVPSEAALTDLLMALESSRVTSEVWEALKGV